MDEDSATDELSTLFEEDAGMGLPYTTKRDMACMLLPGLDYEAQLTAIAALLSQHEDADARTTAEIKAVDEFARKSKGLLNEQAVNEWVDRVHSSTYESAAHSMAALGMIAPLLESFFYQAFQGIRNEFYPSTAIPTGHRRAGMLRLDDFWDCHCVFDANSKYKSQKKLVPGIMELAEAVGLTPHLPAHLLPTLEPLFRYRNKMFHHGFEWPSIECERFAQQIVDNKWEALFSSATRDDVPFIFYMNPAFISQCMALIHDVLESFGSYCEERIAAKLGRTQS